MAVRKSVYLSRIETSGPIPGDYSMLSLGACVVRGQTKDSMSSSSRSTKTPCLTPEGERVRTGQFLRVRRAAGDALASSGLGEEVSGPAKPVFVGFNAGFRLVVRQLVLHTFPGRESVRLRALDVKAYYMGLVGCGWRRRESSHIRPEFQPAKPGDHNALADARAQAEMFEKMLTAERP